VRVATRPLPRPARPYSGPGGARRANARVAPKSPPQLAPSCPASSTTPLPRMPPPSACAQLAQRLRAPRPVRCAAITRPRRPCRQRAAELSASGYGPPSASPSCRGCCLAPVMRAPPAGSASAAAEPPHASWRTTLAAAAGPPHNPAESAPKTRECVLCASQEWAERCARVRVKLCAPASTR